MSVIQLSQNQLRFENAVREFLGWVGESPTRPGLLDTPNRLYRMCSELLYGYTDAAQSELEKIYQSKFPTKNDQLIVVRDIGVFSLCEHHWQPFFGTCDIGYLPGISVLGLSKFSRVVRIFSQRFQIQEGLTDAIADSLVSHLECQGLIVSMNCKHLCCIGRGVKDINVNMLTSSVHGLFRTDASLKSEFFSLVRP